jgi:hypothetical protein
MNMRKLSEKRRHPRVPLTSSANVLIGNHSIDIAIGNVSAGGVLFHADYQFNLGDMMSVIFRGEYQGKTFEESVPGKVVTISRKDSGNAYGLKFVTNLVSGVQPFLTGFVNRTRSKEISFLRNPEYHRAQRKE